MPASKLRDSSFRPSHRTLYSLTANPRTAAARQKEKAAAHFAETNHISRLFAGFGPNLGFQQFHPQSHLQCCKCPHSLLDSFFGLHADLQQIAAGLQCTRGTRCKKLQIIPDFTVITAKTSAATFLESFLNKCAARTEYNFGILTGFKTRQKSFQTGEQRWPLGGVHPN